MGEQDLRAVSRRQRWITFGLQVLGMVISFALGSITGGVDTYIGIRRDEAALAATQTIQENQITALGQTMAQWRADNQQLIAGVQKQLGDVTNLLTDLRIRLGPKYR